MKQLYLICHNSQTAVRVGDESSAITPSEPNHIAVINTFFALNHQKDIVPLWDDDDAFNEIVDIYTFITLEDIIEMDEVIKKIQ